LAYPFYYSLRFNLDLAFPMSCSDYPLLARWCTTQLQWY